MRAWLVPAPMNSRNGTFNEVYDRLLGRYGPQEWWPANDPFEIVVGAVLTQGTAWTNAARGIEALKTTRSLHPAAIDALSGPALAERIRPAGFHNVKTGRLKAVSGWWLDGGGYRGLRSRPTGDLRAGLLRTHGIGRETADAIVLYAFGRRVFVVDAYARRVFSRVGLIEGGEGYEKLREEFEERFDGNSEGCNEYHALIVEHGKVHCRARPRCHGCCLADVCAHNLGER